MEMEDWKLTDSRTRHMTSFDFLAILNDSTCCEYDGLEVLLNRFVSFCSTPQQPECSPFQVMVVGDPGHRPTPFAPKLTKFMLQQLV